MQDRIAHYRIESLVGEGAFAWVYRALDERLERHVALKVLRPFWMSDPKAVARFQHEAKMMARLHHPHVVVIHEVGEEEGQVYLAEYLVEGESVAARLRRGPIRWHKAMRILEAVASALDYAHSQGIVHRDIKPANILLAEDGGVYLTDFGLVRAAEGSVSISGSTGGIVGTPPYMAPEQWRGEQQVTGATDVYALSCVVVELLTGKVLFEGSTPAAITTKHVVDRPTLPEGWPPGVPPGLDRVLRRGLARDAAERFASAGQLVSELAGLTGAGRSQETVLPPAADESEEAQMLWGRPLWWALAAIGLVAVGAMAALLVSGILSPSPSPTPAVAAVSTAPPTHTQTRAPARTPTAPTSPSPSATFMPAIPTPAWTTIRTPTHTGTPAIPTPAWTTVRTPTHTGTPAIPTLTWTDTPTPPTSLPPTSVRQFNVSPQPVPPYIVTLGSNVMYQPWGKPTDPGGCRGPYDDNTPVRRFTVQVIVTNNSNAPIADKWLPVFVSASGRRLPSCIWHYGNTSIEPGATADVTFVTHLDIDDYVRTIVFDFPHGTVTVCLDNAGLPVSCD